MPVYSSGIYDRIFVQLQTAFGAFNNSSGTWTNTGSIWLRSSRVTLTQTSPILDTPYHTGSGSQIVGTIGRRSGCSFEVEFPLIPSGAAGTAPDADPVFQAAFQAAPTIVPSTSVTYTLGTAVKPLSIFWYDLSGGSSPIHRYALTCIVKNLSITFNGEFTMVRISGPCGWVGLSSQFSLYTGRDAPAAGGLTVYPAMPTSGAPVTVSGIEIPGQYSTFTMDGNLMNEMRGNPVFNMDSGMELITDTLSSSYPFAAVGGMRRVGLDNLKFVDNDGANIKNLISKSFSKATLPVVIGNNTGVAGSTTTINLPIVQLGAASMSEGQSNAMDVDIGPSRASASAIGLQDEATMVFT